MSNCLWLPLTLVFSSLGTLQHGTCWCLQSTVWNWGTSVCRDTWKIALITKVTVIPPYAQVAHNSTLHHLQFKFLWKKEPTYGRKSQYIHRTPMTWTDQFNTALLTSVFQHLRVNCLLNGWLQNPSTSDGLPQPVMSGCLVRNTLFDTHVQIFIASLLVSERKQKNVHSTHCVLFT